VSEAIDAPAVIETPTEEEEVPAEVLEASVSEAVETAIVIETPADEKEVPAVVIEAEESEVVDVAVEIETPAEDSVEVVVVETEVNEAIDATVVIETPTEEEVVPAEVLEAEVSEAVETAIVIETAAEEQEEPAVVIEAEESEVVDVAAEIETPAEDKVEVVVVETEVSEAIDAPVVIETPTEEEEVPAEFLEAEVSEALETAIVIETAAADPEELALVIEAEENDVVDVAVEIETPAPAEDTVEVVVVETEVSEAIDAPAVIEIPTEEEVVPAEVLEAEVSEAVETAIVIETAAEEQEEQAVVIEAEVSEEDEAQTFLVGLQPFDNVSTEFDFGSDVSIPSFYSDLDFSLIHDAKSDLEEIFTLLTEDVTAGAMRLSVKSQDGFVVGMTILVGSGPKQEVRELVGLGRLMLDRALEYDHPVGTTITGRIIKEAIHTTVEPLLIDPNGSKLVHYASTEFDFGSDISIPSFYSDLDFSLIHDATSEFEEVFTLLAEEVTVGAMRLSVKSQDGFEVGMTILVGSGPKQEVRELVDLGRLMLDRALEYDHPVGTTITGRIIKEAIQTMINNEKEEVDSDAEVKVIGAVGAQVIEYVEEKSASVGIVEVVEIEAIDGHAVNKAIDGHAVNEPVSDTLPSIDNDEVKAKHRKVVMFEDGLLESKDVTRGESDVYYRSQSR